ncbi:MAG: hypothetical protein AMXMBFR74_10950 [Parvibaculum sp.]
MAIFQCRAPLNAGRVSLQCEFFACLARRPSGRQGPGPGKRGRPGRSGPVPGVTQRQQPQKISCNPAFRGSVLPQIIPNIVAGRLSKPWENKAGAPDRAASLRLG